MIGGVCCVGDCEGEPVKVETVILSETLRSPKFERQLPLCEKHKHLITDGRLAVSIDDEEG